MLLSLPYQLLCFLFAFGDFLQYAIIIYSAFSGMFMIKLNHTFYCSSSAQAFY
jgi:hypothetical protein